MQIDCDLCGLNPYVTREIPKFGFCRYTALVLGRELRSVAKQRICLSSIVDDTAFPELPHGTLFGESGGLHLVSSWKM